MHPPLVTSASCPSLHGPHAKIIPASLMGHVAHFPYVDLATCDAGTFPLVTSALRNIESPGNVVVMRNGQLGEVASALRALP